MTEVTFAIFTGSCTTVFLLIDSEIAVFRKYEKVTVPNTAGSMLLLK